MILVVTGLLAEAKVVAGPGVRTVSGGGRSARLLQRLEAALAPGDVTHVLSFGLAGALIPGLPVGALGVAAVVRDGARRLFPDPAWTARLAARTGARPLDLAGVDAAADSADAKAALRLRTGCALVDMESHLAAAAAAARGLPFAVLRAVSDGWEDALPPAATAGLREDGGTDVAAVLRGLLRDPRQLPALVRLGRDTSAAMRRLRASRALLGATLGATPEARSTDG